MTLTFTLCVEHWQKKFEMFLSVESQQPFTEGYIAVILPKFEESKSITENLLTREEFENIVSKRSVAESQPSWQSSTLWTCWTVLEEFVFLRIQPGWGKKLWMLSRKVTFTCSYLQASKCKYCVFVSLDYKTVFFIVNEGWRKHSSSKCFIYCSVFVISIREWRKEWHLS